MTVRHAQRLIAGIGLLATIILLLLVGQNLAFGSEQRAQIEEAM